MKIFESKTLVRMVIGLLSMRKLAYRCRGYTKFMKYIGDGDKESAIEGTSACR